MREILQKRFRGIEKDDSYAEIEFSGSNSSRKVSGSKPAVHSDVFTDIHILQIIGNIRECSLLCCVVDNYIIPIRYINYKSCSYIILLAR